MRIGLFIPEIGRNVGGLETYEVNLLRALASIDINNTYHLFFMDPRVPDILNIQAPNFFYHCLGGNRFTGVLFRVARAMADIPVELFHATFIPPPITALPFVLTLHGSETLERPDFYPWLLRLRIRVLLQLGLSRATRICCVSEYLSEYAESRGISRERIATTLLGCDFEPIDRIEALRLVIQKFAITAPYILCVGRIEPRKNPLGVIEAYSSFRKLVPNAPRLVFVGDTTWSMQEVRARIHLLQLSDYVDFLGHLDYRDLPPLYAASEMTVFASLWEGFGLPAIEAMRCGSPLVTSNCTSLPEVVSNAALLVDPAVPSEICDAMVRIHLEPGLRKHLIKASKERAKIFTWENTARATLKVYEEAYRVALSRGPDVRIQP